MAFLGEIEEKLSASHNFQRGRWICKFRVSFEFLHTFPVGSDKKECVVLFLQFASAKQERQIGKSLDW